MAVILAALFLAVSGGAFYGGMLFGRNSLSSSARANAGAVFGPGNGQNNRIATGNRQNGAGFISGDVISSDDKSITLKLRDGGSKIVILSDSTQIMKSTSGSASDISGGESLMVQGATNSDGSITAQTIQIRPATPQPTQPAK